MTGEEALEAFERMMTIWPKATIRPGTPDEYVRALRRFERNDVHQAIDELAEEVSFLPSIAEVVGKIDLPAPSRRLTADELHWSGHNPADFPD